MNPNPKENFMNRKCFWSAAILILSSVTVQASVEKPWEVAFGGGWTIAQQEMVGYLHSQSVMWGSVGYHAFNWLSFGMEGGHFFGKDQENPANPPFILSDTMHVSSIY